MATTAAEPIAAPVASRALNLQIIRRYGHFLELEPAWDSLLESIGNQNPFLEFSWARSWWDSFGSGSELNIVVIWDGEQAVAIVPLMRTPIRMMGLSISRLGFFYNSHVPRTDFIVARGRPDAYRLIWQHLTSQRDWDLLQLCQLETASQTMLEMLELAHADGYPTGVWASSESPYVGLDQSWPEYSAGLATKHRSNLRNRFKRLKAAGNVRLETASGEEDIDTLLDAGYALEAAAWKGEAGTAIASSGDLRNFYHAFAQSAARRGWLRLHFLCAEDRRIAFDYSLEYNGSVFLLKQGYDPEYSAYSPSNLLLSMELEEAAGRRGARFDFLGDFAEWKRCWAQESTSHSWLYIFARTPKARLAHYLKFVLAPIAKRFKRIR